MMGNKGDTCNINDWKLWTDSTAYVSGHENPEYATMAVQITSTKFSTAFKYEKSIQG